MKELLRTLCCDRNPHQPNLSKKGHLLWWLGKLRGLGKLLAQMDLGIQIISLDCSFMFLTPLSFLPSSLPSPLLLSPIPSLSRQLVIHTTRSHQFSSYCCCNKYHKLNDLKQMDSLTVLKGRSLKWLSLVKIKALGVLPFFLEALEKNLFPLPFPIAWGHLYPLANGPILHLLSQQ